MKTEQVFHPSDPQQFCKVGVASHHHGDEEPGADRETFHRAEAGSLWLALL